MASWRRLSAAVALSSPRADTQIRSRNSLAQCLMVHQHQVQCDTEAPVCAPSSQLLSTVSRPSVTKCCAVTPVLERYPPQHIYDLNEATSFLLSINNWAATEGDIFFSTAIWKGHKGAWVYPARRDKMHIGKLRQTEYCCCWRGVRRGNGSKFTQALFSKLLGLFHFMDICIESEAPNLFEAADIIQTVNTGSQPFLPDPHFHLIHT